MAGKLTDYAKNLILKEIGSKTNTLNLGTIYIALLTNPGSDVVDGGITGYAEPATANNYERVPVGDYNTASTQVFGNPTGGVMKNSKEINFNSVQSAAWGTITHWALFDSPTRGAGNCIAYGHLLASDMETETSIAPAVGEKVYFAVNAVQIDMNA